ncbi:hypothetical protein TNCV_2940221 [Trichonephila clavipes]|nr:hypothetical protein TNCV_2940221 [Trichonephila clavipes]
MKIMIENWVASSESLRSTGLLPLPGLPFSQWSSSPLLWWTLNGCGSLGVKVLDRGWRVTSSSPIPLKRRRVGKQCTLNLSRAQTSPVGGTEPNRIVICRVINATSNDKRKSLVLFHIEQRGPQSDTVRQMALEATTTMMYKKFLDMSKTVAFKRLIAAASLYVSTRHRGLPRLLIPNLTPGFKGFSIIPQDSFAT